MTKKSLIKAALMLLLSVSIVAQPTSKHDLLFDTLASVWDEAIPLGNGTVGALIYQREGSLRFALDRSDLWDERPMKGLQRKEFSYQWVHEQVKKKEYAIVQQYFDLPYDKEAGPTKISGGALEFETKSWGKAVAVHLSLKDAVCTVKWSNGIVLKTFVHATKPLGWFRFENVVAEITPTLKTPNYKNITGKPLDSLKSNDPAKLGYAAGIIAKINNTITYHQPGYAGFFYDISVTWVKVNKETIEGVWSLSSNINKNEQAETIARQSLKGTYTTSLAQHTNWWKTFWSKSSIQLPDSVLEKQWYRDQYKLGASARTGAPPILLQGVWTADNGRLPPWKGDYHHDLNTEMSYWPSYSANHLEESISFIDHLEANKANYKRYTKQYFGKEGINVPGVSTLNGTEMGGWIQYALSPTIAGWLSHHYYLQWKYSGDNLFLTNRAYPWLKEVAKFFKEITIRNKNGFRELPISSSPEINNNALGAWFLQTTNYDLSLIKFVFAAAAEMAVKQGLHNEADNYRKLLSELRDYALSDRNELLYAPDSAYCESHRHFSHAMAIHPLGLIKWEDGQKAQLIITNTIRLLDTIGPDNWNGYSYAWLANLKARAKDGEGAAKALNIFANAFCSVNSFHINGDQTKSGYSKRAYRPFTLEGNFGAAAGLQEMLLQSYAGFIEIMPAIPASWKDASFTTLRAEGAFLVSAKKEQGDITEVKIFSEKGGMASLKLPFDKYNLLNDKGAQVKSVKNGFITINFEKGGELSLSSQ